MNILGLNFGHDGSACIVKDGKLVSAITTERITKKKKQDGITKEVIEYVLSEAGITLEEVDFLASTDWTYTPDEKNVVEVFINGKQYTDTNRIMLYKNQTLTYDAKILGLDKKLIAISHHMGHCAATYYTSNFDEAFCFSLDASGGEPINNSLVAKGTGNKIFAENIPGLMVGMAYADFTRYTGIGDPLYKAGSLMGLSSYGKPINDVVSNIEQYVKDSYFVLKQLPGARSYMRYYAELWRYWANSQILMKESDKITNKSMNLAASIQFLFENAILDAINNIQNNNIENLCLSGGSMLNCNANTLIKHKSKFKNIHHFPACGDDGNAVGAALYVAHHINDEPRHKYSYKDLMYLGKKYDYVEPEYTKIAEMIADGKIIAWFMGGSEFGPRALGARSILADPRNFHNREILNFVIKNREWFRPFAPVVLEEESEKWFDFSGPSPFMLYTAQVLQPEKVPGITHIDGSARMQTINEETNRPYYKLVKEFFNITGVPMLINTSLNGSGQPILETPEDAINFLKNNEVDALVLNGELILKSSI